jgi:hypothetical protein
MTEMERGVMPIFNIEVKDTSNKTGNYSSFSKLYSKYEN